MTTEERLEKLEQDLAGMKNEIRTKKIIIENDDVRGGAMIASGCDGALMGFFDENDNCRLGLGLFADEPYLVLHDEENNSRVKISSEAGRYGLILVNEDGKKCIKICDDKVKMNLRNSY